MEDEVIQCKMKVRDRKPKCCEQIKGKGGEGGDRGRWGSQAFAGGPITTQTRC